MLAEDAVSYSIDTTVSAVDIKYFLHFGPVHFSGPALFYRCCIHPRICQLIPALVPNSSCVVRITTRSLIAIEITAIFKTFK